MNRFQLSSCAAAVAALSCGHAAAQQTAAAPPAPGATQTVVVTGNPLRSGTPHASAVLSGDALLQRRAGSLGETLDGLPGVAASGFGPNASRPVIRGLDGDRVRLLDNGGTSTDASNLSFDHASATDPLVAERIEVLRGPAALLYGGNATGGVVNSIDNRIPRAPMAGVSGRAEARLGGAASERGGAAVIEGGMGASSGLVWHADAFGRQSQDLRAPRYTPVEDGEALDPSTRVRNSAARGSGGAVGAGWAGTQGFAGASLESTRNRYGVTVEPDVFIRMQRERAALAGEWRGLGGPLQQISAQASRTRYQHEEVEGTGEVGTTFKSTGSEVRLQAVHAPLGPAGQLRGVVGVQGETLRFEALGAEAFVPTTHTRSSALFALEEVDAAGAIISAGARVERARVASDGDAPDAAEPKFGSAAERRFSPFSWSLGARLPLAGGFTLNAHLGQTQRAPAYYELYANGVHVATAAFERGDPQLGTERSRHMELGAGWASGAHGVKLSVFNTRFARYIGLEATGQDITIPGENGEPDSTVPEYAFRGVRARMQGLELEGRARLLAKPWVLDLTGGLDRVQGDQLDSGEPLPRLAPQRVRVGLEVGQGGWRAGVTWRQVARQNRVPATDTATPGYHAWDLWAHGALPGALDASWYLRLNNATNQLGYNAAAVATVRGLSPMPGRALAGGVQLRF